MSLGSRERSDKWKTRALRREDSSLVVPRFRLEVLNGRDRGAVAASSGTSLGVGTARGNELILTDGAVSHHHCTIEAKVNGFLLRDLESTNGTGLGDHRIIEAYVRPGDLISLGESTLRFDVDFDDEVTEAIAESGSFGSLLGGSPAMRRVFALLERLANVPVTVLITGETGTGKGAVAEALHQQGSRKDEAFVVVDCGAIPYHLMESELFGHEKGAFTGAENQHIGAFERAHGGTVFLDEVGELDLEMQPKLLRVLESKEIRRVGGSKMIPVDVRIMAATNRDLRGEINSGGFRSDLYYRLNVMGLELPPLRDRREDIPTLVESFYRRFVGDEKASPPADLLTSLMRQRLPGNVRELRAAVERRVVLGDLDTDGQAASPGLASDFDFTLSFREAKERMIQEWEERYLPELVERYDGNLSRAARAVRMDRNHLRKRLASTKPKP